MAETEPSARRGWLAFLKGTGRLLLRIPTVVLWGLALGWMAVIWRLSGSEGAPEEEPTLLGDVLWNFAHAPLFGLLGLLVAAAVLRSQRKAPWPRVGARELALVLGWVAAYGILDEWHQSRVPGRHASPLDVVTDLVGGACVIWIVVYLGRDGASEAGVRRRLLAGLGLCLLVASIEPLSEWV